MNKIAVTGANGMTGSHMVSILKNKKIPFKEITRKDWDLSEWKSLIELDTIFSSVQAVFHFGAQLPFNSLAFDNEETQKFFDVNIRSCLNLAEWAKIRNIPIIFLSGALVYKDPYAKNIKEQDAKVINGFGGFYGYSKLISENILNHFSLEGLDCVILRPSSIYGYGLAKNKLIQSYIDQASDGKKIQITGSNNKINLIHAYDVANAALEAYQSRSWGIFNISSKKVSSIKEIAETAISVCNRGDIEIIDKDSSDNFFVRFDLDSNLAKKSFAFCPKISLHQGMKLMKKNLFLPC
jgi:UDP-glucose 4-epimerase